MNKLFLILLFPLTLLGFDASDTARLNDTAYLRGYWRLAGDARDYSGHGNHGTWSGTEAYQQGPFGKDVGSFNGSTSKIAVSHKTELNSTTFTISFWHKTDQIGETKYIVEKTSGNIVGSNGWAVYLGTGGSRFTFAVFNSVTVIAATWPATPVVGKYYYITCTYNSSTLLMYIDGKYVATGTISATFTNISNLSIGSALTPSLGTIDSVRYYNTALTASEVAALYSIEQQTPTYTPIPPTDPTCQLLLWNGQDYAQGRTITNYKTQVGSGVMKFNGSDSYLSTPDFIGTNDFTAIVWFRANSLGENATGRFLDNGKLWFYVFPTSKIAVANDGSTAVLTDNLGYLFPQWNCITITRTGSLITFYRNGLQVGNGQNAGTPTAATTALYIGNRSLFERTFDGLLGPLAIYNRVMSAAEIAQYYNDTVTYFK